MLKTRIAAVFLTLTLIAGACLMGGCFFAGTDTGTDDGREKSEFELDPDKEYSIEFMMWGAADEIRNYKALVGKFREEYPNVQVRVTDQPATEFMKVLTGRLTGTMPDVFYMPEYEFKTWVDAGRLMDLSNGFTDAELDAMWPTARDWYSYNRAEKTLGASEGAGLYCLPKDIGPWTLMYNVDMLDELHAAGILTDDDMALLNAGRAMTWKEFVSLCVKIQQYQREVKKNDLFYALPYYETWSAVWSNNADFFTDNAMESRIGEDNFVEAVEWLWDLQHTYGIIPASTGDTAQNMFLADNCAFCWVGPYLSPMYWSQQKNFDLIPVPYNGDTPGAVSTTWIGTLGLAVSKSTAQPAAALALVKYLSLNEDAQRDFYTRGQLIPNLKWMAESENEYLSKTSEFGQKCPQNRAVYCDIVDGFRDETDRIGGRVRPHYWTYENTWTASLDTKLAQLYQGSRENVRPGLLAYEETFQALLDKSNESAGIYRK